MDYNNKLVFSIDENDVNTIAKDILGRGLTKDEMDTFKHKFVIDDWTDYVEHTLNYIIKGDN